MTDETVTFDIYLHQDEADDDRLVHYVNQIKDELLNLGAESAQPLRGAAAPQGAKGDAVTLGAIALVTLPAALPNIISFIQSWSLRGENRKVRIKTAAGLEVEFTPDKKLSESEVLQLARKLSNLSTNQK